MPSDSDRLDPRLLRRTRAVFDSFPGEFTLEDIRDALRRELQPEQEQWGLSREDFEALVDRLVRAVDIEGLGYDPDDPEACRAAHERMEWELKVLGPYWGEGGTKAEAVAAFNKDNCFLLPYWKYPMTKEEAVAACQEALRQRLWNEGDES